MSPMSASSPINFGFRDVLYKVVPKGGGDKYLVITLLSTGGKCLAPGRAE